MRPGFTPRDIFLETTDIQIKHWPVEHGKRVHEKHGLPRYELLNKWRTHRNTEKENVKRQEFANRMIAAWMKVNNT